MKRISHYIIIKKETTNYGCNVYKAYWRGTSNRVKQENKQEVSLHVKKAELIFDLRNNPMERGVIVN